MNSASARGRISLSKNSVFLRLFSPVEVASSFDCNSVAVAYLATVRTKKYLPGFTERIANQEPVRIRKLMSYFRVALQRETERRNLGQQTLGTARAHSRGQARILSKKL